MTNMAPDNEEDEFFDQLKGVINASPSRDAIFLLGDFNAGIGSISSGFENVMGWKQKV